jgi:hypothetical protein
VNTTPSPFERALGALEAALALPENDVVRDATIQRFQRAFDLATRHRVPPAGWAPYQRARKLAPYCHEPARARKVYEAARAFALDARTLARELDRPF